MQLGLNHEDTKSKGIYDLRIVISTAVIKLLRRIVQWDNKKFETPAQLHAHLDFEHDMLPQSHSEFEIAFPLDTDDEKSPLLLARNKSIVMLLERYGAV